jgi:uncharacterized protein DUF6594
LATLVPGSGLESPIAATSGDLYHGWPGVAWIMAKKPDFEAYARFREENAKNLLYYQVELCSILEKLRNVEDRDVALRGRNESDTDMKRHALDLIEIGEKEKKGQQESEIGENYDDDDDGDDAEMSHRIRGRKQWRTSSRMRRVLKEYS